MLATFCSIMYFSNFNSLYIKISWRTLISSDLILWSIGLRQLILPQSACRYRSNIHYLMWINQFTIIFLNFLMDFSQNVFCFWPFSYSFLICSSIPNKCICHSQVKAESLKQAKPIREPYLYQIAGFIFIFCIYGTSISGFSCYYSTYMHRLCFCMAARFQD